MTPFPGAVASHGAGLWWGRGRGLRQGSGRADEHLVWISQLKGWVRKGRTGQWESSTGLGQDQGRPGGEDRSEKLGVEPETLAGE